MDTFHEMFWTFWLRAGQTAVESAPTLLTGVLIAGLMRMFIGEEQLRMFFGKNRLSGALRAWLIAAAVPVCSFGVLPIVCEMRRARVQTSAIIAFLLAAPVFNLWSLIYGVTAMPMSGWFCVVFTSLFVSIAVGLIAAARLNTSPTPAADESGPVGSKPDRWWLDIGIGLVGVGMLAALLPAGAIEHRVCEDSLWNIGWLTGAMVPAWVSPEVNVVHVREAFRIGMLPGAAVPIALLGGGLSVAALSWVSRWLGLAASLRIVPALTILVIVAGIAVNVGLAGLPEGTPDSHGFDALTQPYHTAHSASQGLDQLRHGVLGGIELPQAMGFIGLAIWGTVTSYRRRVPKRDVAHPGSRGVCETTVLNRPLSKRALVTASLASVAVCAVLCLYVYFPPVEDTLDEMNLLHTDVFVAVRTRELDEAQRKLAQMETLLDRLPIGAALRFSHSPQAGERTTELRTVLEDLRQAVARKDEGRSESLASASFVRLIACREAYLNR
ncbi:MAG: permease [Phycisphaerae bacterium]